MLNYIWAFMLMIGIGWGAIHGQMSEITQGILGGAKDAVSLSLTMLGILAFWSGIMEIAQRAGILQSINRLLSPVLDWLFPDIERKHPAREYISMNIAANILGLGWAATPSGLEAMKQLQKTNPNSECASNAMCAFLVLNISSLQLIPVNVIAYRSEYGSIQPAAVTGPAIIATLFSTIVAIVFIKFMYRKS